MLQNLAKKKKNYVTKIYPIVYTTKLIIHRMSLIDCLTLLRVSPR
jgi:hypothetical protein